MLSRECAVEDGQIEKVRENERSENGRPEDGRPEDGQRVREREGEREIERQVLLGTASLMNLGREIGRDGIGDGGRGERG